MHLFLGQAPSMPRAAKLEVPSGSVRAPADFTDPKARGSGPSRQAVQWCCLQERAQMDREKREAAARAQAEDLKRERAAEKERQGAEDRQRREKEPERHTDDRWAAGGCTW